MQLTSSPVVSLWISLAPPHVAARPSGNLADVFGEPEAVRLWQGEPFESLLRAADRTAFGRWVAQLGEAPRGLIPQGCFQLACRERWLLVTFEGERDGTLGKFLVEEMSPLKEAGAPAADPPQASLTAEDRVLAGASGIWDWDLVRQTVFISARTAELLGYPAQDRTLSFEVWEAMIHPDDRARVISTLRDWASQPLPLRAESRARELGYRVHHQAGHFLWVEATGLMLCDETGRPRELVGSLRDVTEARRQADLKRRQLRLLDLVADVQQAFLLDRSLVAACDRLFEPLLALTESQFGFIGILREAEDGSPFLEVPSISNISWDEASRTWYNAHREAGQSLRFHTLDNLFGHVVTHNAIVRTDHVEAHPASRGSPAGHPGILSFLGIPLRFNGQAVGMIAMANRPGGYDETLLQALLPFTSVLGSLVQARTLEERRAQAEAALLRQARHDELTGLSNRRHFFEQAAALFEQARREGQPATLALMDIDFFKQVNDTYGHAAGDEVLRHVARLLRATLRETDIYARVGGEEFAILLPQTALEPGLAVLERLRRALEAHPVPVDPAHTLRVTTSIGACPLDARATAIDPWLHLADTALYQAKQQGRNRVCTAPASDPPGAGD